MNPKTKKRNQDNIPFLGERPDRETIISEDDILNLTIALNSAKTLEEFLELV